MAKTIINLSDPVSTLVSKTNTLSDNVGDLAQLNVGASNDSDLVQAINFLNTNNTDSAAITALIDSAYVQAREGSNTTAGIVALLQGDSANGIGLDSSEGRFFVPSNTINTAMLESLSVTTAKIAADAINGSKIADDVINSEHYVDGSIDTAHIGDLQVTTAKIAADAVTNAKIADNAVDIENVAHRTANHVLKYNGSGVPTSGTIDTANITADAVTEAKIADDAVGQDQMKTLSTLLIINSSGTTVKTIHGAGA
jgi:hypothetical protein